GEWTHDPKPAETRAEPTPSRRPNALQGTLQDAVGVAPALRTASGVQLPPEACERLGYRPAAAGVDPGALTLGLCPGMSMSPSVAALAPVVPAVPSAVRPSPQGKAAGAVPAPRPAVAPESKPARQVATKPRPAQAPAKTPSASAVRVVPAKPEAPAREMIPPSARYVQVGAFADGENALIVLRRLSERGYPTGQARARQADKGMRVIMAGPFPDRQKLIEALNDLRANGYPGAVAR
ncbi:MAG: hypothetical protein FJX25_18630, partial [Alphaproteobacteria bacterium]|nr:hypothetical protein [Alphaproteobacteria bacterium]